MKNIFLDTNIIIGLLYENDRIHRESTAVVDIVLKRYKAYISPSTFVNCHRKLRKLIRDSKERNRAIVLLLTFNYSSENQWIMDQVRDADFHNLEDALQYFSALTIEPDAIVTEDVHDFQPYSKVPVFHPLEFLQLVA